MKRYFACDSLTTVYEDKGSELAKVMADALINTGWSEITQSEGEERIREQGGKQPPSPTVEP